jgi:hypothetical protein
VSLIVAGAENAPQKRKSELALSFLSNFKVASGLVAHTSARNGSNQMLAEYVENIEVALSYMCDACRSAVKKLATGSTSNEHQRGTTEDNMDRLVGYNRVISSLLLMLCASVVLMAALWRAECYRSEFHMAPT